MIPADAWPEWADRHCWDESGAGFFFGVLRGGLYWYQGVDRSKIPLPPGHDWRVPVMRHQPVDLEQLVSIRNRIHELAVHVGDGWDDVAYEIMGDVQAIIGWRSKE